RLPGWWGTPQADYLLTRLGVLAVIWYLLLTVQKYLLHDQSVRANLAVARRVRDVEEATVTVASSVERMSEETGKAQMLAIRVGVVMTLVGALIGGFAGAWAAHVIG